MENNTVKKVTKAQRYADIVNLLDGVSVQYGTTVEQAKEFIAHEIELLTKKNSSKSNEPTPSQKRNEVLKNLIIGFLSIQDNGMTCTQIGKGVPELNDEPNQKVSSLMQALWKDGQVKREKGKGGATLYSIA